MKTILTFIVIGAALLISIASFAQMAEIPASQPPQPAYSIYYSPQEQVDALFAAFVDAIPYASLEEFAAGAAITSFERAYSESHSLPDFKKLLVLRDRFGYMPEYWQMLYCYSPADAPERNKYLEKAYMLFPQDPRTIYFYAVNCASYKAGMMLSNDTRASAAKAMQMEQDIISLVAHAAEMDGSNGYYWYEAAFQQSVYGGVDDAMPYVVKGNEAPLNWCVRMFPYNYIRSNLPAIKQKYPEKYLLIGVLKTGEPLPNYIKRKDFMKIALVGVSLSGNLDWLTQMHRYACRYGEQEGADEMQILSSLAFCSALLDGAVDIGYMPSNEAELKAMMRLNGLRENARGIFNGYIESMPGTEFAPSSDMDSAAVLQFYEKQLDTYTFFVSNIRPHITKLLIRMEAFDFAYPAVFPEVNEKERQ